MLFFRQVPWFSRLWVLQEVTLARAAILVWDDVFIDWKSLSDSVMHVTLERLELQNPVASHIKEAIAAALGPYTQPVLTFKGFNEHGVGPLLRASRDFNVGVDEDRVYALHGMLGTLGFDLPPPDYSLPIHETFRAQFAGILRSGRVM